jgi:hypothetical protein
MVDSLEQQTRTITRWIAKCEHLVAFTGAGISTDSGTPDFRGPKPKPAPSPANARESRKSYDATVTVSRVVDRETVTSASTWR